MLHLLPQSPRWVPYRFRRQWDDARIAFAVRGVTTTAPVDCAPAHTARCDVHMLLCARDLQLGVLALKSLLRYAPGSLAVTVSDDGTLQRDDIEWVNQHLRGCRWMARVEGPLHARLAAAHPRMATLYAGTYAPMRKLIHPMLAAGCQRVIVLDPDTAFFSRPDRLMAWVEGEHGAPLFLHDHQDEEVNVPVETRDGFVELEQRVRGEHDPWTMPFYFFNSGLLAYEPATMRLAIGERYLEWRERADQRYFQGKADLWFGDWTPEQTIYQLMFAVHDPIAEPLDDDYWLGGDAGHCFNHFMRYYLVQRPVLGRMSALPRQIHEALSATVTG